MVAAIETPPNDVESLKRLLALRDGEIVAERAARLAAEAEVARVTATVSSAEALIAHLRLAIEKMKRELYGARSERSRKLLDQMELELEELEATAAQDEIAAEMTAGPARRRSSRLTRAGGRSASRCPIICRASGSSSPVRRPAPAAVRRGCPSSGKTSPRPLR
jgi:hypothetical protein